MADLIELDSLEILVIVDNELDPFSPCPSTAIQQSGGIRDIAMRCPIEASDPRGGSAGNEVRMDNICCSAHGLSLMITGIKGDKRHTILFDAGPEEDAWERNARRLRADIGQVEIIQLSHWHRDHSGGMLRALKMIYQARGDDGHKNPVQVDLHPNRPDYRGAQAPGAPVVSLEADPTFDEIESVKGKVIRSDKPHTVLENMFLISGEIPRITEYEKGFKYGVRFNAAENAWEPDEEMADERMLMCKVKDKGLILISGCSHAGIVNATKHTLTLCPNTPLHAIMGGFHLGDAQPATIQQTVTDLKAMDPKLLLAGHCTGWRAKFELERQMKGRFVPCFVGSRFVL